MHQILDPGSGAKLSPKLCALGVMTKAPQPGKVKTRLTPPLTPEEAAQLNTCFLRDLSVSILQAGGQSPAKGVAVYTPRGAETSYANILPEDFILLPQRAGDFGARLISAAEDLFAVGFGSVCLINSDSPTVPAESFAEAAIELANPGDRVILGPSKDGGYYLIGLKRMHRRLFEEIDWSTDRVCQQTKDRATELHLPIHELATGLDVDDATTLSDLCEELFAAGREARSNLAQHTRTFLREIIDREGRERIWPTKQ
jgi:uncharacterized protein